MNIQYNTSNTNLLIGLNGTSLRVLLVLMDMSKYNLLDMIRIEDKAIDRLSISIKTFKNSITKLVKANILIKGTINRVYFIDPSICICGKESRVMRLFELVSNTSKVLLELDRIENKNREDSVLKSLDSIWKNKRYEQEYFSEEEAGEYLDGMSL